MPAANCDQWVLVEAPGTAPGSEELISKPFIAIAAERQVSYKPYCANYKGRHRFSTTRSGEIRHHEIRRAEIPAKDVSPMIPSRDTQSTPELLAKPYRLTGLCLSLVAIGLITLVIGCFLAGLVFIVRPFFPPVAPLARDILALADPKHHPLPRESLKTLGLLLSFVLYTNLSLAILLVARWRGGPAFASLLGWQSWHPIRNGGLFWRLTILTILYGFTIDLAMAHLYPPSQDWFVMPKMWKGAALIILLAVVFAPIAEELLFRGWIQTSLTAQFGPRPAIMASSLLFAFAHYEKTHLYALVVLPIGLALGVLRERNGLKASITLHACFNGAASVLAFV